MINTTQNTNQTPELKWIENGKYEIRIGNEVVGKIERYEDNYFSIDRRRGVRESLWRVIGTTTTIGWLTASEAFDSFKAHWRSESAR